MEDQHITHDKWRFDTRMKNHIYKNNTDDLTLFENDLEFNKESQDLEDQRRAALIHKIVRKKALSMLKPDYKISDLVDNVENTIQKLCSNYDNAGIAFPVGVNINNIVAHDSKTVMVLDDRVFCDGDVVKIDIGVHVNGNIIDSAFTHIIGGESVYGPVLEASRDSMFAAIKMCGPEQNLYEMSESIQEIIESYEVPLSGDTLPIRPVAGIGGHNIEKYKVHGGKLVLSKPDHEIQGDLRMEEGETYAIETYATTGRGVMTQNSAMERCTHYMEGGGNATKKDKKYFRNTELYDWMKTRKGLPFSISWIHGKVPKLEKALKLGIPSGQVIAYPPLYDEMNSVVAQFEHTVNINENNVEILSLSDDY